MLEPKVKKAKSPEEQAAKKAKKDQKLAAMTPDERQAHEAKKAEKKASKNKE